MNIERQEIRTGLLVFLTLAIFVTVLIYLGSPGVFSRQKTFHIYFNDAAGMKPGAQVMLAGRKIGQVRRLFSPVPEGERPTPKSEVLIEVRVAADAPIYEKVRVQMAQPKLLGESVIDFTNGEESSGLAEDGHYFLGEKPSGIADAVPIILDRLDPVLKSTTATLESLQKTADNLTKITSDGSDLTVAFAEFRQFGKNLNEISGETGPLRKSLANVETITGPDGKFSKALDHLTDLTGPKSDLAKTLENTQKFTDRLVNNRDLEVTLRNFRHASEKATNSVDKIGDQFSAVGANLQQASDTVKHQPWRLIWPSTKTYDEGQQVRSTRKPETTSRPKSRR